MQIIYSANLYARLSFMIMLVLLQFACFYPFHLKKDRYTVLRCILVMVFVLGIGFGLPEFIGPVSLGSYITFIFYALTFLGWRIVTDCSFFKLLYYSTIALALENLTVNLSETILGLISDYAQPLIVTVELPIFLFCFKIALIFSCKREKEEWTVGSDSIKFLFIAALSLFAFDILTKLGAQHGLKSSALFKGTLSLVDIMILIILWYLHHTRSLKTEKEQIEEMLKEEKEQYLFLIEEIEQINIIYHDLKHQLEDSSFKSEHYREEALQSVREFETIAKTGNKAFDSVLTKKTIIANKENIHISFFVSPHSLDKISDSDIFSFFSNAIDNAIECIRNESDAESNQIGIRVTNQNGFVKVHMENPCKSKPEFTKEGLPITTKKDKPTHGFGTKSMRYIIQKYDGNLVFSWNDGFFLLDAVLQTIA